jgi:hypothetical protein
VGSAVHAVVLMVIGDFKVEVELSVGINEYILSAEGCGVIAEWEGEGAIAGSNPNDGGSDEEHEEPAEEGSNVHAFTSGDVRVIEIKHQKGSLVMRDLHLN